MTSVPDTRADVHLALRGAAVDIDGVTVRYPSGIDAIRDASLDIGAGEVVALLGPSGSGKTSLLRAIAGLERPATGMVSIGGRVVSGPRQWVHPEARLVGMVFQDGSLFPHLTVAENIAFGLRSGRFGATRAERLARVELMLELVDLAGYGDRLPETLSGGQQQRVALARSLAPEPSVLLLDEPFSALDATLRTQVRAEVSRIVRDVGVTTVFVTHDQDEAFVVGDRVAVLRDGRIEQVGTPDELYRSPASAWIAGFVGEANLITGEVGRATDGDMPHGEAPRPGHASTRLGPVPIAPGTAVREGGRVHVLVRPEHVALREGDCALVTNVEYYGHDVRYELELADGSTLAARTKSSELHERGERVCARFEGPPVRAWPVDGDGSSTAS